jgi:cupin 2 domain-containing protein
MTDSLDNLFERIPAVLPEEVVNTLWQSGSLRVERIVSFGHASPPDFWYDSDLDEWVVLLSGSARLRIDGRDDLLEMKPGDYVVLQAHTRHRVEWTAPDRHTIWLAVHQKPG